jgi:hypothetical protein
MALQTSRARKIRMYTLRYNWALWIMISKFKSSTSIKFFFYNTKLLPSRWKRWSFVSIFHAVVIPPYRSCVCSRFYHEHFVWVRFALHKTHEATEDAFEHNSIIVWMKAHPFCRPQISSLSRIGSSRENSRGKPCMTAWGSKWKSKHRIALSGNGSVDLGPRQELEQEDLGTRTRVNVTVTSPTSS